MLASVIRNSVNLVGAAFGLASLFVHGPTVSGGVVVAVCVVGYCALHWLDAWYSLQTAPDHTAELKELRGRLSSLEMQIGVRTGDRKPPF